MSRAHSPRACRGWVVLAAGACVAAGVLIARAPSPAGWDAAHAACGPELFSKTARKQLNYVIRRWYRQQEEDIRRLDARWMREGIAVDVRARRAFAIRREARLESRRMMRDPDDVKRFCERDLRVYGDPNGPSFEWLVEHEKAVLGTADLDRVYEQIIRDSETSSRLVDLGASVLAWTEWLANGLREDVEPAAPRSPDVPAE